MDDIQSMIDEAEKANGINIELSNENNEPEVTGEEVSNSEAEPSTEPEGTKEATPASEGDAKVEGVTTEDPAAKASETNANGEQKVGANNDKPRKEYHRSEDPLARARYTASKYKQKYNALRQDYEERLGKIEQAYSAKLAEYEKFSKLNPAEIKDDADRQEFLAWREATANSLDGMREKMEHVKHSGYSELSGIENARREMLYNAKVENCYGGNDAHFRELEEKDGDAYEVACNVFDKDNVIRDFMENSDYEPAIKNIIYENDELQDALFRNVSKNPMIAANQRLNILRNVERSVAQYYENLRTGNVNQQNVAPKANVAPAVKQAVNVAPKARPTIKRLNHVTVNKTTAPAKPTPKFGATGNLTRGNDNGGEYNARNIAENEFKNLFG